MTQERDWPLVDVAVVGHFNDAHQVRASTKTPPDLEAQLAELTWWVRAGRGPGSERAEEEQQVIDFDCFGLTEDDAWDCARWVRRTVLAMHNRTINGARIDTATTEVTPHEVPWSDDVVRVVYSARFTLRRRRI